VVPDNLTACGRPGGAPAAAVGPVGLPRSAGVVCVLVGIAGLSCWLLQLDPLRRVEPHLPLMRPPAAACCLLVGVALLSLDRDEDRDRDSGYGWRLRRRGTLAAGAAGLAAGANLVLLGTEPGVSRRLFPEAAGIDSFPRLMTGTGAVGACLVAVALLTLGTRRRSVAQPFALVSLGTAFVGLLAALYDVRSVSSVPLRTIMSVPTAVFLAVASVGVLAVVPGGVLPRIAAGSGSGSLLARRLLPVAASLPLIGGLCSYGRSAGWYGASTEMALMVIASVSLLLASVWRASVAVEQADAAYRRAQEELRAAEASTAREFQRVLLPATLPRMPGIETVARYVPAGDDAVGGDWYDVLPLPRGGVGLVMGDVEGHSATAAVIMAQARNVLRAYAAEGHSPGDVLSNLNRFVSDHTDCLITCCYLHLDPAARVVTAVTAGHPAPIVLTDDGGRHLPVHTGLPLGVDAAERYEERTTVLEPRSRLVLYTDGLIDERSLITDPDELLAVATALDTGTAPDTGTAAAIADALVRRSPDQPSFPDDTAVLVACLDQRQPDDTPGTATRVLASAPAAAPAARRFVHDVLTGWGLTPLQDVAELLASELVTNAILHTGGEVRLTLAQPGPDTLRIGVHDDSDRPARIGSPRPDDIGGRGLTIVDALADGWWIDPSPAGGKTVWLELTGRS